MHYLEAIPSKLHFLTPSHRYSPSWWSQAHRRDRSELTSRP